MDESRSMMSTLSWKAALAGATLMLASGYAVAQTGQNPAGIHRAMPQHMPADMQAMHAQMMAEQVGKVGQPTMPGQDAFGAIQEIVRILEADPDTDWSKVNLEALRQHLIDMNEVTLKADATPKQIDGGLEITITGSDRTLVAIQRMIPAWVATMNGHQGWITKAAPSPNGEILT